MKKLIMLFRVLVIMFLMSQLLYSQDIQQGEFMIINNTGENGYQLIVDIYPVGAIFNGNNEYTLKAANPIPPNKDKIWGVEQYPLINNQSTENYYVIANFDKTSEIDYCNFPLGYGRYRIDINGGSSSLSCYIDFSDANYTGVSQENYFQKIKLYCLPSGLFYFCFIDMNGNNTNFVPIYMYDAIKVWEQFGTNHSSLTPNKGNFSDYIVNGQYHDYPIDAKSYGFFKHLIPEEVFLNLKVANFDANLITSRTLNINNCNFEVGADKTFIINQNSQTYAPITITGEGAKFTTNNNSTIIFPPDCELNIRNNASIESNGTTFTSSSGYWHRIFLENPGSSFINNCTLKNAIAPIHTFKNHLNGLSITNNTFNNISLSCIEIEYTNNVSIMNNHFYLLQENPCQPNRGISIYNYANTEEDNNDAPWYRISIIGNDFHDGNKHIIINPFSENILPVYIKGNIFNNGAINMFLINTIGSISDNIIENSLTYECESNCISLWGSNPDFLNNTFRSNYNNFNILNYSYPNLAPIRISDNQFLWKAGKNKLISNNNNNIWAAVQDAPGYFYTDYGKNEFTIQSPNFHLWGFLKDDTYLYPSNENCWYGINGEPQYNLVNINNENMTLVYEPENDCNSDFQIADKIIKDMGNGIFDTVLVTQSSTLPPPSYDLALYGAGIKNKLLKNYSSAIINFKNLINTYPNSNYLGSSVYNLYECYVLSDTNRTQSFRSVIFGNLKNYLEDEIQQYESNDEFVNLAFDFTLKCKVKMKNYLLAMDGYQFIAENSPSETERLIASLNYIDVEGLIPGHGGGIKGNKNEFNAIGNINKQENKTPIKDILLKAYYKTKDSKKQKENLALQKSNDVGKTRADLERKHNFEKTIEKRALNNISISGSLNAEQRRERIRKDLLLLTQKETDINTIQEINSLPINYSLSQNYPNPFNPVTKISYSIAKQGLVTLKIYDMLGREIKTLVNEVKQAGYYTVEFNGSSLASGVYFYRIQCGDFISVKRMVMVK